MQEANLWRLSKERKIYFSPRFGMKEISNLLLISTEQFQDIEQEEKCNFESAHILMDSERFPFISAIVLDFLIQEVFIKDSDLQALVTVINKIGEIKMDSQDREAFQEMMIDFRQKLVKTKKHHAQRPVFDEILCDFRFQDLLIGQFYYAYMMKVCNREQRQYLEKSEQSMKECFETATKIFKVTFKIYEVQNQELKLAHTVNSPSGKNFSVIYLIYHKNVFIQVNLKNNKSVNESPSPSENIHAKSKNPKDWFQLARRSSVNSKLQKQHPKLQMDDSMQNEDSDEDLFHNKKEQKKSEEDQNLDDLPRQASKKQKKLGNKKETTEVLGIQKEDVKNFHTFLEKMIFIIMSSYKKLDQQKQDEVFEQLNAYFQTLKKSKFNSQILKDFKKTIKDSINKMLQEDSS